MSSTIPSTLTNKMNRLYFLGQLTSNFRTFKTRKDKNKSFSDSKPIHNLNSFTLIQSSEIKRGSNFPIRPDLSRLLTYISTRSDQICSNRTQNTSKHCQPKKMVFVKRYSDSFLPIRDAKWPVIDRTVR